MGVSIYFNVGVYGLGLSWVYGLTSLQFYEAFSALFLGFFLFDGDSTLPFSSELLQIRFLTGSDVSESAESRTSGEVSS